MDILKRGTDLLQPSADLLKLIKRIADDQGSEKQAIDLLRNHFSLPQKRINDLIKDMELDAKWIRTLLGKYSDELTFLLGSLADAGSKRNEWPLKKSGKFQGGPAEISLDVSTEAFVETDADGEMLDGAIRFNESEQVCVHAGVMGKLGGAVAHNGMLGSANFQAAFRAGGDLGISNYFIHHKSDRTLHALLSDLTDFKIPGAISMAHDLRADRSGAIVIPLQYVHLSASGMIELSANVEWSGSFLNSVMISSDALNIDDTISIKTGLEAGVSLSHVLSGDFNLIIYASPDDKSRIRVDLAKSRTSDTQFGFELGAEVGIEGLDRIGKSVLNLVLPKLNKLIKHVEDNASKYGDIKKIFETRLSKQLDQLLKDEKVIGKIDKWLNDIAAVDDLKKTLKDLIVEKALELLPKQIDDINKNVKAVRDEIIKLIKKYRDAVEKINGIIEKAAKLKLGVHYSRERHRMERDEVALSFDINLEKAGPVFRQMLLGDFRDAIQSDRNPAMKGIVDLRSGAFVKRGSLTVKSELNINIIGFPLGSSTIFSQEWDITYTITGEILIGVGSSLASSKKWFGRMRTCTFLADTRILGMIGQDAASANKISIELTEEMDNPKISQLEKYDRKVQRLGVTLAPTSMVKDIALPSGGDKPFGPLTVSILLELGKEQIDRIVNASDKTVRHEFAKQLLEFSAVDSFREYDNGLPLLLWDSVQNFFKSNPHILPGSADVLEFPTNDQSRRVQFSAPKRQALIMLCRIHRQFCLTIEQLRNFRGTLKGLNENTTVGQIKAMHRNLMKTASDLVKGSDEIRNAFFKTLFILADSGSGLDPFVTVIREKDERIFVYG